MKWGVPLSALQEQTSAATVEMSRALAFVEF
jgi:hypothetical protein